VWLAPSDALLPVEVEGPEGEDMPVDYHDETARLIFIADEATDLPIKFEPFSPTLFRPRGSCIAPFPRSGEYRIAVWSDDSLPEPKPFSIGLGLAERDVFSPTNLLTFDYTLMQIQSWNGWHPFVLLLPLLLLLATALATLAVLKNKRPDHFGTASGWPTPFRLLACVGGSLIIGHAIANLAVMVWAVSNAHAGNEFVFPLVTQIVLPTATSIGTLFVGFRVRCCCGEPSASAHCGHRITLIVPGLLHLMLHAGYIVAPVLLLLASVLPPSLANAGLASKPDTTTIVSEAKKGQPAAAASAGGASAVDETPKTQSMV